MAKWADYCITGVRYNSEKSSIEYVEVREDLGDSLGKPAKYKRDLIIDSLEEGTSFITVLEKKNPEGKMVWVKGAPVSIVKIDNTKYIRTDRNNTKKDNLESLPEI